MISGEAVLVHRGVGRAESWRGRRPPVRRLATAMLAGDVTAASDLTEQFFGRVRSRVAVFADLLHPAQSEIGDEWYRGRVSAGDEHRAALVLERLVAGLPPTPARSRVAPGTRCLLAVPPGERHTLGLAMLALALEDEGWDVELLDPECEPADVPLLVDRARPRLVCLSAATVPGPAALAALVAGLRDQGVPVLAGGAAFNRSGDLWRRVGATAHGADVRIGSVLARRLLSRTAAARGEPVREQAAATG